VQHGLFHPYAGDFLEVNEQFIGLVEKFVFLSDLRKPFCLPNFFTDTLFHLLNSVIFLFPYRNVHLGQLETLLGVFFLSEILDSLNVGIFLLARHHRKDLDVLDILEVVDLDLGDVEHVKKLDAGKHHFLGTTLELEDGRSVENCRGLILDVVFELLYLLLSLVLECCKVEVLLPLVPQHLVLQIVRLLMGDDPIFDPHRVTHPQFPLLEGQSIGNFAVLQYYRIQKSKPGEMFGRRLQFP
jgi:hypothetical protein